MKEDIDELVKKIAEGRESVLQEALYQTGQLRDLKDETFYLREQLEVTREQIAIAESEIYSTVSTEIDHSTNKPLYSNDSARKAETSSRASEDAVIVALLKKSRQLARDLSVKETRIDMIRDQISLAKHYLHGGE